MIDVMQFLYMSIILNRFIFISEVGDLSRGWPEGSFFNSYYTEV